MTKSPTKRRRRTLLILALAAALAVPVVAATISVLRPPQNQVTERVTTDHGVVSVVYRPSATNRDFGFKVYGGTVTEGYFYQVREADNRLSHTVVGQETVADAPLSRIKAHFLKVLPGAQAKAVGNRKVGRYIITRDKGNEGILIDVSRPAGKSSTIKIRRVLQGKTKLTAKPTPRGHDLP